MRIFKYIFKMSMLNTLISFLVIIGLVWVSQSFRSIKFIFEKGGTIFDFFQLSIFSMPAWLSISVSFGLFFGVFITTSWLSIFKFKEMQETKLLLLVSCQQKQLLL